MSKVKTRGWLGPSIIKSLAQKFGERANKERLSLIPGPPRFIAGRLENPEDKVRPNEHETNRDLSMIEFLGLVVAISAAKCD